VTAAQRAIPERGAVFLVDLDPTRGSEIQKTRPCVVVSPNELNQHLRTVVIAPLTSGGKPYSWRVSCVFDGRPGSVALDQIRTVDRERLVRRLGEIEEKTLDLVLATLGKIFSK